MKNAQYQAVPRGSRKSGMHALCDDRKRRDLPHNPNTSSALYGVTTGRYDALAVRTQQQADAIKEREAAWVERSFGYEGLGVRASGRGKVVDPDLGASRPEKDTLDEVVRSGGTGRPKAPVVSRGKATYTGAGTRLNAGNGSRDMTVRRKAPGAKRAVLIGSLSAKQTR